MEKIRVLITDHHRLMREGIEAMLQNSADIEVIGLAASGAEAIAMTSSIKPDVVLIDVLMPTMNGIELHVR